MRRLAAMSAIIIASIMPAMAVDHLPFKGSYCNKDKDTILDATGISTTQDACAFQIIISSKPNSWIVSANCNNLPDEITMRIEIKNGHAEVSDYSPEKQTFDKPEIFHPCRGLI
jgi:hypothetical protein